MLVHCLGADAERPADFRVGLALGNEREHFALPVGKPAVHDLWTGILACSHGIDDEAVAEAVRRYPDLKVVGVLGATASIKMRLYQERFEARGIKALTVSEEDQEIVQGAIDRVKAGDKGPEVRSRVREMAEKLAARGAQLLLTACTELPLVLHDGDASVPVLDPTQVLAEAAVRFARGE